MNLDSCECTLNEVEFFSTIPKQVVLDSSNFSKIYPLSNVINDSGPIEFNICGTPDHFIDLNNTMLELQVKIVNADANKALIANDVVAPVNNWLCSLFEDAQVTLGETVIEGGDHMFPYKAYFSNLFSHSKSSKETQLIASGWYPDQAGQFESATGNASGFVKRKALTATSTVVHLCGPLPLDFFLQNKYLIHNTDMKLRLSRASADFQVKIRTADDVADKATAVKVDILSAVLHIRQVKPLASYLQEVSSGLMMQNAVYPIQHTEMLTFTIPANSMSENKSSLFNGRVPKAMFVAFVENSAYNGSYTKEPFHFQHFKCNSITLYQNSLPIPFNTLTPDFDATKKKYMLEYQALMQTLNIFNKVDDVDITPEQFANGYTIFGFNLTPDLNIAGHAQTSKDGNLRLDVRFAEKLTSTINVIVMGIFDGRIEISKNRQVMYDWKA